MKTYWSSDKWKFVNSVRPFHHTDGTENGIENKRVSAKTTMTMINDYKAELQINWETYSLTYLRNTTLSVCRDKIQLSETFFNRKIDRPATKTFHIYNLPVKANVFIKTKTLRQKTQLRFQCCSKTHKKQNDLERDLLQVILNEQ